MDSLQRVSALLLAPCVTSLFNTAYTILDRETGSCAQCAGNTHPLNRTHSSCIHTKQNGQYHILRGTTTPEIRITFIIKRPHIYTPTNDTIHWHYVVHTTLTFRLRSPHNRYRKMWENESFTRILHYVVFNINSNQFSAFSPLSLLYGKFEFMCAFLLWISFSFVSDFNSLVFISWHLMLTGSYFLYFFHFLGVSSSIEILL